MNEERRFFQYLAGERQGEIVEFDKIEEEDGMVFIAFKDGSRVNEEFIQGKEERQYKNTLVAELDDPDNPWTFKEEWKGRQEEKKAKNADGELVIVQPFIPGRKKVTPIPPKKTKSKFGQISNLSKPKPKIETNQKQLDKISKKEEESSSPNLSENINPVWLMLDKAKKVDTEVEMLLTLSLPSKDLFKIVEDSFENGAEDAINYIINNIKTDKIKSSLKKALLSAYKEETNSPSEEN